MCEDSKSQIIDSVKDAVKFFELSITLKIFGRVIWSWVFPPSKS